jgi:general secretion pathway protein A
MATIRELDRPSLLRLVDERGRVAHALVTGVAGDQATVSVGGNERSIASTELARVWRGEIATLWRAPPAFRDGDLADSTPAGTTWIAERLAARDGVPLASGKDALRARIAAFQLAQGLTPDGLAGPLTVMQLARASQDDEPRLRH